MLWICSFHNSVPDESLTSTNLLLLCDRKLTSLSVPPTSQDFLGNCVICNKKENVSLVSEVGRVTLYITIPSNHHMVPIVGIPGWWYQSQALGAKDRN